MIPCSLISWTRSVQDLVNDVSKPISDFSAKPYLIKDSGMTNDKPIALDAYETLAEAYASVIDTKPHNAYYERPATLSLLPDVNGETSSGCGLWSGRVFRMVTFTRRGSCCA